MQLYPDLQRSGSCALLGLGIRYVGCHLARIWLGVDSNVICLEYVVAHFEKNVEHYEITLGDLTGVYSSDGHFSINEPLSELLALFLEEVVIDRFSLDLSEDHSEPVELFSSNYPGWSRYCPSGKQHIFQDGFRGISWLLTEQLQLDYISVQPPVTLDRQGQVTLTEVRIKGHGEGGYIELLLTSNGFQFILTAEVKIDVITAKYKQYALISPLLLSLRHYGVRRDMGQCLALFWNSQIRVGYIRIYPGLQKVMLKDVSRMHNLINDGMPVSDKSYKYQIPGLGVVLTYAIE